MRWAYEKNFLGFLVFLNLMGFFFELKLMSLLNDLNGFLVFVIFVYFNVLSIFIIYSPLALCWVLTLDKFLSDKSSVFLVF